MKLFKCLSKSHLYTYQYLIWHLFYTITAFFISDNTYWLWIVSKIYERR